MDAGVRVERIRHSGKLRAEQTASILAEAVCPGGTAESMVGLAPKNPPEPLLRRVEAEGEDLLLVSHLPFVGELASRLLTGSKGRQPILFVPGTLAVFERGEAGSWTLLWMLPPDLS